MRFFFISKRKTLLVKMFFFFLNYNFIILNVNMKLAPNLGTGTKNHKIIFCFRPQSMNSVLCVKMKFRETLFFYLNMLMNCQNCDKKWTQNANIIDQKQLFWDCLSTDLVLKVWICISLYVQVLFLVKLFNYKL